MIATTPRPLVGLSACSKQIDEAPYHAIGDKYLRAVDEAAGLLPVVFPAFGEALDVNALLDGLSGLVLTGSPSNVHPQHYEQTESDQHAPFDEARDGSTLALIPAALERGLPIFAICRGMQELNVALGGSLCPAVHLLPGHLDHRRPETPDPDIQYGPRHPIEIDPDGLLATLLPEGDKSIEVNSLHHQAIDRLAQDLKIEARAPDGTIEAVRYGKGKSFAVGVQWHPEYKATENPVSRALFRAFARAVRHYAAGRYRL
ncbi:MAG: gamma-glutamyl-gamma-aminobutyrate hydrolase family protein [Pseudomonadota bacterium]